MPSATRELPPQQMPRVAFQGERGAYGDDAIGARWGAQAIPIPSWSFDDVISAVHRGTADYGILPAENSVIGRIDAAHTVLQDALHGSSNLTIVDEVRVPVQHALLAPVGATFDQLEWIFSHPAALAQCRQFFAQHPRYRAQAAYDTAGAARDVAARNDPREGAIASISAAARYKLQVMAERIQDHPDNHTRFVVIARRSGDRW